MADDLTEKQLREIEKAGEDLTRSLNKARMEIRKAGEETNAWFDATKTVQSATEALNKATEKQTAINDLITKNKSSVLEIEKQNFDLSNKAGRLLAKDAELQARIAAEHAIMNSSVSSVSEEMKNQARLRAEDLAERRIAIVEEINGINSRVAGNFEIIDALNAQTQDLVAQSIVQTKLVKQEKDRRNQAQLLKGVYDNLFGPLLGDSKEFKNLASLGNSLLKGGARAYLAILKASLDRWQELDKAALEFRKTTGFLTSQTKNLDNAVRQVNVQMANLGIGLKEAYEAAGALTEEFQVIGLVTKEAIANTAMIAANLGLNVKDAAKFKGLFESISESVGSSGDSMIKSAAALADMAGVAPRAVLNDMANASEETLAFLAKSPMALMRATVEARRLGTTVNSLSKSARGFLNYQDSITSELEASALIGKSLNFQEARAAAYAGDVVKSRELALKQIEKAGDFTRLNVYQQEALAKAAGMTTAEIIKQQNQQKLLAKLEQTRPELYKKYMEMQQKIKENEKAAAADLGKQAEEMAKRELMQGELNKLTNAFSGIWTNISDSLLAIANTIMPPIVFLARLFAAIFKVIGGFIRGILKPFDSIMEKFRSGNSSALKLEEVFVKINAAADYLSKAMEKVGVPIGYVIMLGNQFFLVLYGVLKVLSLVSSKVSAVSAAFNPLTTVSKILLSISNWFGKIGAAANGIFKIFKPFTSLFSAVFKVFSVVAKFLGPIGLIINAVQVLWEFGKSLIEIWSSDDMNIFEKIIASLVAIPKAIWNALVQPIIDGVAWVLNKIWPGMGDGLINGIKAIGTFLYDTLIQPFVNAYNWIKKKLMGNSPSEIGLGIVNGIKSINTSLSTHLKSPFEKLKNFSSKIFGGNDSIGDSMVDSIKSVGKSLYNALIQPFANGYKWIKKKLMGGSPSEIGLGIVDGIKSIGGFLLSALTLPFKNVVNFVSKLFGGRSGSVGESIIKGIKSMMGGIFDLLVSPFKNAYELIKKIPVIGKLFGGGDATAAVNTEATVNVEKQVAMAVEIKNLDEFKETVNKLTEAISKLGGTAGGASPVVNVNNNQNAMIEKLDELIGLLKDGAIAVNMDGILVSRTLAKTS